MFKKNRLRKNVLFISIFLISLIIFISIASANLDSILIHYPMQNSIINGICTFNASVNGAENVTFYYYDGDWIDICFTDEEDKDGFFTCERNTTEIDDDNYTINATARNGTDVTSINITNVTIDNTPPTVVIIYPIFNDYDVYVNELNYTVTDENLEKCWYSTDEGLTNSTPHQAGKNFTNVSHIPEENNWTVYCNDSAGNIGSANVTFNITRPEEVWVNANFQNNRTHFNTINSALFWVADGGNISVYEGIYEGDIEINKSINIRSNGEINETIIDGSGCTGFLINSSNVLIEGFNISNVYVGIYVEKNFENITVTNNIIEGIGKDFPYGGNIISGIWITNSSADMINNNISNVFSGVFLQDANSNISNNVFSDVFIGSIFTNNSEIEGNYLNNNEYIENKFYYANISETFFETKICQGNGLLNVTFDDDPFNAINAKVLKDWNIELDNIDITMFKDTNITSSGTFNIFNINASNVNTSDIKGFNKSYDALKFGIPNFGLNFDQPINITINMTGMIDEKEELNIFKSMKPNGPWAKDGLVDEICTVTEGLCNFQTEKASYFTVADELINVTLTIDSEKNGNVTRPGEGIYNYTHGEEVELRAVADSGYIFDIWEGNVNYIEDINRASTNIIMLDNYTVTATFEKREDDKNGEGEAGAVPIPETQKIEWDDDEEIIEVRIKVGDTIIFYINGQKHNIELDRIAPLYVDLQINSNPINLRIFNGETRKVDITRNGNEDISIYLERISAGYAYFEFERYEYEEEISEKILTQGEKEFELKEGDSVILSFEDASHEFLVKELNEEFAIVQINSDPIEFIIYVGETKEIDLDGDGFNDISIYLKNINEETAVFFIEILEKEYEIILEDYEESEEQPEWLKWLFIILGVAGVTGALIYFKILKVD